jgi:hypothetical protein
MESKILVAMAIVSSCFALFSPVSEHKYQPHKKDSTTIKAEKYLHELEEDNNKKVEDLKHDVDSLLTIKRKIKIIYLIKDSI